MGTWHVIRAHFRDHRFSPDQAAAFLESRHDIARPPVPLDVLIADLGLQLYTTTDGIALAVLVNETESAVVVGEHLDAQHRRWLFARGLGHVMLHDPGEYAGDIGLFPEDEIARESVAFAAELLMPSSFFGPYSDLFSDIRKIASLFGVPFEAAYIRMHEWNPCLVPLPSGWRMPW